MSLPFSVLTIAGSDSGGGAGIQADLKTFAALGLHGLSAIAALTAQNTRSVTAVHVPPIDFLRAQIDACFDDFRIGAVKLGMLANKEVIDAVADALEHHRPAFIVLDPVMVATSGARLLEADALDALRARLFPLATILTPNIPEAELLLGRRIADDAAAEAALEALLALGMQAVLLKGGHLPSGSRGGFHPPYTTGAMVDGEGGDLPSGSRGGFHPPYTTGAMVDGEGGDLPSGSRGGFHPPYTTGAMVDGEGGDLPSVTRGGFHPPYTTGAIVDRYCDAGKSLRFTHPRIDVEGHGTGCTLASAIAANLCLGKALDAACEAATDYVHGALRHAVRPGRSHVAVLNHFWQRPPCRASDPGESSTWGA